MTRTLRWRLAVPYALLVIAIVLGLGIYLIGFIRDTTINDLKTRMTSDAHLVADAALPFLSQPPDTPALQELAVHYASQLNMRVTIIDPTGVVMGESQQDPADLDNHLPRPEVRSAISGETAADIRYSNTLHMDMLYVAVPVRDGGRLAGVARVAVSLLEIDENTGRIRGTIVAAMLIAISITLIISMVLTGYTIRPLQELTEATRRITGGDFNTRLMPYTRDEIGQLNEAFNQMAIQLRSKIEALQAEQGKLGAVLAHMTDGVLIVDEEGRVQLINPAAADMFDTPETTAIGRTIAEVARHYQIVDLWRKCLETGEQQLTTLDLSAEKLFLQGIATSLTPALPGSVLLLFQDLTRLRRLETIRQDFISNVSHELRTPLASLKALTETLQEGALEDPPAAQRFLTRMDVEIDTLTQMVRELLELSRIESGRVPLQRKPLYPQGLLAPAVERMRLQAARAKLTMRVDCADNLPAVNADLDRMEQVLVNLLHNAIKFTPPGGEIVASATPDGDTVVFSIRDTGVGIAAKDLTRIFERFYKADRARSGGGTGLGLSIARHLIEAHGGKIWAESIQGQGSTFYFSLPISKQ